VGAGRGRDGLAELLGAVGVEDVKKAGLVTTRRRGRYVLHRLDVTMVSRLGSDFLEGILR